MSGKKIEKRTHLIGARYGKLVVTDWGGWIIKKSGDRIASWKCLCDCGNKKIIIGTSIQQGLIKSCGCLRKENGLKIANRIGKVNSGFYDLMRSYKNRSKHNFDLSEDDFKKLTSSNCHYCGCEPYQIRKKVSKVNQFAKNYIYNGIDRINSSKGYTISNCLPCCGCCNRMKNDMNYHNFLKHIKTICDNFKDISDYIKNNSIEKTKEMLKLKLNNNE